MTKLFTLLALLTVMFLTATEAFSATPTLVLRNQYGEQSNNIVMSGTSAGAKQLLTFTSAAGTGGAATEAMTLTGILSTDTIVSVSQMTKGLNSLPLLGYSTLANNSLTAIWSAAPGAGAVIVVTVQR